MAWSQTDLENIEKAIASGTRKVMLNNRMKEYQTIEQMLDARDAIKKALEEQAIIDSGSDVSRRRAYRVNQGKGL